MELPENLMLEKQLTRNGLWHRTPGLTILVAPPLCSLRCVGNTGKPEGRICIVRYRHRWLHRRTTTRRTVRRLVMRGSRHEGAVMRLNLDRKQGSPSRVVLAVIGESV